MAHDICHVELTTGDPEKAKAFYQAMFSWEMEDVELDDAAYTLVQTPEGINGGLRKKPEDKVPTNWLPYVEVADLETTLVKVAELGGRVAVGKTAVNDFIGHFAIIQDPTGAVMGIFEAPKED